ncbi:hypothetical protein PUN28_009788 [Cardiocondyla obscurior]|uniref:Uncharacterized protein n=1 Tax=Cardiocondyla obscurior TaxID=286306 RepID=A0AAW2FPU6_9HYME
MISNDDTIRVRAITKYFNDHNLKTLGDTHFIRISLKGAGFSFKMVTYISIGKLITFTDIGTVPSELIALLLFTSYADTISLPSERYNSIMSISPIEPVVKVHSLALISSALQMRKTFIWDNEMGVVIIASKGSMKTLFINMLRKVDPMVCVIDSDVYGRWITAQIQSHEIISLNELQSDNCIIPSYFELIASAILRKHNDNYMLCLSNFRESYANVLSHAIYGIAKFQDAIALEFGHTQILLFLHTTVEANLSSGKWQQIVLRPIHDTADAVKNRDKVNKEENIFLHYAYNALTPLSNRSCLNWLELMILLSPEMLNVCEDEFFSILKTYGKYDVPSLASLGALGLLSARERKDQKKKKKKKKGLSFTIAERTVVCLSECM